MAKRKPIDICSGGAQLKMQLIGDPKENLPYIAISGYDYHGYIKDRDIRRLRDWCDKCLAPSPERSK
jgi:hypothetical protein